MVSKDRLTKVIDFLYNERKTLPEYNTFGESNWIQLDKQLVLLESALAGIKPSFNELKDCIYEDVFLCYMWIKYGDANTFANMVNDFCK